MLYILQSYAKTTRCLICIIIHCDPETHYDACGGRFDSHDWLDEVARFNWLCVVASLAGFRCVSPGFGWLCEVAWLAGLGLFLLVY